MIQLNVKKLREDAKLPEKHHDTDAGIDFYTVEDIEIFPNRVGKVASGIAVQPVWNLPTVKETKHSVMDKEIADFVSMLMDSYFASNFNIEIEMRSRSGLFSKQGILIQGTVDQEYTGEIYIMIANHSTVKLKVPAGTKIAQGVLSLVPKTKVVEVTNLMDTDRGDKGFGSSGK